MKYCYETHLHTREASKCATASGAEQVRSYYEAGYTGIIVTDHFFNGNTCVPRKLPWKQRIDLFCSGYENAKAEGNKLGVDVFFGWESGFCGTDFLIYGLDKEWLMNHEDIIDWSIEEQYEKVKADGGYVVQAHPFREVSYIPKVRLYPEYCDAVEVVNAANNLLNPVFNERAYDYALQYDLPMTSGSDVHHIPAMNGGMEFDTRLNSIYDYISSVDNRKGRLLNYRR